jgi:hypothetical protein
MRRKRNAVFEKQERSERGTQSVPPRSGGKDGEAFRLEPLADLLQSKAADMRGIVVEIEP